MQYIFQLKVDPPIEPPRTPPHSRVSRPEATTRRKARFYHAIDTMQEGLSKKDVCTAEGVPYRTGMQWLRYRRIKGSPATRRVCKSNPGPALKVSDSKIHILLDINNPVRDRHLSTQIDYHNLNIHERILRRNLRSRTRNAKMYRKAAVKEIGVKNKKDRIKHGELHKDEDFNEFWKNVWFIDEAHYDPSEDSIERVLREEGSRYKPENTQERPSLTGIV